MPFVRSRVYVCIRVRMHHRAPEIPFNLRRLSARSRVITRNFVRLKLANTETGAYIGNARFKDPNYQRASPLPWSRIRETRERPPRIRTLAYFFRVNEESTPSAALGLPFYRISFSRDSILNGRKQKSDIVFADEKIKHWIDSQIWAIKKMIKDLWLK